MTLYPSIPLLHGLEKKGLLESYEEHADSARVRKYYRLTQKGKKFLQEKKQTNGRNIPPPSAKFWKEVFAVNVSDAFHRYAEKVCEQIRWKKAHPAVAQEIEDHLTDQKNAYLAAGDSESIAEEKALLQMGDPVSVGAALDQTHKPAPQWGIIGLVLLLFVLGGIIQVLLLKTIPVGNDALATHSAQVLFVFLPLSLAAFVGMYFLDFSFFGKHPYVLPLCPLLFDVIARMFGLDYGGQKWLSIGLLGLNISPSAISMLFPLAFCGLFYRLRSQGRRGYLISGVLAVVFCLFLSYCHTFSGVVTFVFSAGILMLIASKKKWFDKQRNMFLLLFLLAVVCLIVLLMFYAPFRYRYGWERLYTIFVPSGDPMGSGYLSTQLKTILSHCVLLGEGAALSETQAYLLTDASMLRSDYLLAYLTYHYGWVASGIVVLLLAVFLGLGFRKALKQKSIFGQMVSLTILCTFTAEILLYIPANLGIWLIAPIALPFLSYGATAMLINMALAGVLLSVFRTGEVYRDTAPHPIFSDSKFIQWADGKLTISFK